MDGTAIDTDIDRFIRQQKSKLAAERNDLQNDDEDYYPKRSPRRQWGEPNKENYLSVDVKRQTEEKPATPAHQGYPVDNRLVVKKRKELSVERKKEYNDFLKTQPNNQRKPRNLTPTQKSINVGEYDERRKAMLNAERKKDYDDFMRKKKKKNDRLKPSSEKLPIDDFNHFYYGGGARQHDDDYYGDYGLRAQLDSPDENFYLEELNRSPRVGGLPVGQYEQHKREFGHAIKANYRNDLQKQMKDNKKLLKYKPGYKSKKPAKDDRRQYYVPDDRVYDIERILDKSPRVGGLPVGQYEQRKRDHADETKRKYRHDLEKQVNFKQTLGKTQPGYKGDPMKLRTRDPMLRRQLRVQGSTGKSFDKWERKLHEPIKTLYDRGHDLRPYDLDDEWKRHQLDALNDIDRRQLELRLKIERDNARRHLEHTAPPVLSDEDVEEVSNCPVHIVRENSRSPSPVVVPRLYDPDQLEMYRESPEGLLIGETSTEHKEKLRQERQREYNEMMAQKQRPLRNELPPKPGTPGGFMNKLGSHEKQRQRLQEERHREYQRLQAEKRGDFDDPRMLRGEEPPGAPRKGWGTPTYEEMLEKKRNEEQRYRRLNDPEYSRPGLKAYNSEGALHRLEHGPAARPQVVHEYPPRPIREAPSYLPEANKHRFYATLPVGEKESAEEIQRRKEAYKQELDRQMQEAENARRRNRSEELQEEERKQALVPAPPRQPAQPQVIVIPEAQKPPQVQVVREGGQRAYPDIPGIDRLSPRSELLLGRTRDLERLQRRLAKIEQQQNGLSQFDLAELDFISKRDPRKQTYQAGLGSTGILEQGFDTLLEPPKLGAVKAPPGLLYQPPTYVTGGDQFDKFNTVDQAYHFYGARNPLDISEAAAATNYGAGPIGGGGVVIGNYGAGGGVTGGGRVSPVHVVDQQVRGLGQAETLDGTDTEKKARQKAQAQQYQMELERQIEEKRRKKEYEREEQERYERKLEEDIRNYNPYGRGGGGAPMKDSSGNIIADLRALQKGYTSPRYQDPYTSPRNIARPPSPKDDLIKTPPVQTTMLGENSHARGGHGIFGNPKTEAEKTQADRYKDDLQRQIEKKKRDAELEKERERREEEKQNKIVEEQRLKMQAEYEEEKRRIQAKEEEARLRNLEIVRIQEERKTEEEKLKEELEKKKREEARIDYERERLAREFDHRTDSPLIPTLRHKTDAYNHSEPAARTNSADVLNQLAHMRRQLQSERKRVETMLEETMNEPEVYDPRLSQGVAIPIQHQVQVIPNNNIFDTAVSRNAVHVRRAGTTDPANPSVLQEFSHLKHKDNTDSRKDFRQMYPNDPRTQSELESQQAAFIRQQEERIRYGVSPSDRVLDSSSPQTMLHSQSAFIDVDRNSFPDDFDDLPRRNDSARQRRREKEQVDRYPSAGIRDPNMPRNYNPMGSVTSIDVDHISRKNEDRLKRLKELQGDDVSLYDPDDVLNRFMEKQSHNSHLEVDDFSRITTPY